MKFKARKQQLKLTGEEASTLGLPLKVTVSLQDRGDIALLQGVLRNAKCEAEEQMEVVRDGCDLGPVVLQLFELDAARKNQLVESIAMIMLTHGIIPNPQQADPNS